MTDEPTIRERHVPCCDEHESEGGFCDLCGYAWPCDARRAADEAVLQDALDGAALRLLCEALPEGASFELTVGHQYRQPFAILYARERHPFTKTYWGGSTIAEAADKCREALAGEVG